MASCVLLLVLVYAAPLASQVPQLPPGVTPEQAAQLLRDRPDLVQQQLLQSGLSQAEIRQRLQQAGFSPSLLDAFLADQVPAGTAVSSEAVRALAALGVDVMLPEGLEPVPLLVGADTLRRARDTTTSRVFGLNIFRGRTTQFQPVLSGPVPDSYKVGPGDMLVLVLTGEVELVHQLQVTREGFIVIPQVGQIFVNNLTMAELRQVLRQRLGRSYSGIARGTTNFDVTLARLRTIQVYVIGEVVQPGAYQLASVATAMNALYASGGLTERGNLRTIRVERRGQTVATLDLYDYLLRGSTSGDVVLEQGDLVFVGIQGSRVAVSGAVVRPAVYELERGETLADVIAMSGGFRPDARTERVAVHRILSPLERLPGPAPRTVIDVPLVVNDRETAAGRDGSDFSAVTIPPLALQPADSIVVDSIVSGDRALQVTIGGMVTKPGTFPWTPGLTVRDLVRLARGPVVGADLREAEVARLPDSRATGQLAETFRVPLDSTYLLERDSAGGYLGPAGVPFPMAGTAPEVALQPYDQVTIFRQPQFELQRTVSITGEVAFPGPYALERKDERVSDLVRRAGGVVETAYLDGARFVRQLDRTGRVNVDLTSALARPGGDGDIILQPGDSLDIPEYIPIVRVTGAVNSPVSVRYERDKGFDYYIANAGGFSSEADKGRVSVRYADGSARVRSKFLFFTSYPTPGPGSTIVVPEKGDEGEGINLAVLFGGIAQIMSAVTTMILVLDRLN